MLGPSAPDPTIDLHALIVRKAPGTGDSFAQGRYERNWNTLYVGGLPMEWGEQQVSQAGACNVCSMCCPLYAGMPCWSALQVVLAAASWSAALDLCNNTAARTSHTHAGQ